MRSPKQSAGARRWYSYYAGYSKEFARDALALFSLSPGETVLDPFAGTGTTAVAARSLGLSSSGYDLNPALVTISKARVGRSDLGTSINALTADILRHSDRSRRRIGRDDPLAVWFDDGTALRLRKIERAIYTVLVSEDDGTPSERTAALAAMSSVAAFFYVALFSVARSLASPQQTSNPTWLKRPSAEDRLSSPKLQIQSKFRTTAIELNTLVPATPANSHQESELSFAVASSDALPEDDGSSDAVLTSPPYCTRIDYVVATAVELAVLEVGSDDTRAMRQGMVGTPTMQTDRPPESAIAWGHTANRFVESVAAHESKASSTYYARFFRQYFSMLSDSVSEQNRCLRSGGHVGIVVQDSYYKGLRLDLAQVVREMGQERGWSSESQSDFEVRNLMAAVNQRSRRYRSTFEATESLVVMRKELM